jgi:hypothetical protein
VKHAFPIIGMWIGMKTRWIVNLNVALLLLVFSGCGKKVSDVKGISEEARIEGPPDAPSLHCWFVEDDGAGQHGYAACDGKRGYMPPEGGGLFPTMAGLTNAIRKEDRRCFIYPNYDSETPAGWRVRDLTPDELTTIYSAMRKAPERPKELK